MKTKTQSEYWHLTAQLLIPILEKSGYVTKLEARAEKRERKKWTTVVADKDAEIARLRAELERKK